MQVVPAAGVDHQRVGNSVESKCRAADTVGISSDDFPQMAAFGQQSFHRIIAQQHIARLSVLVRYNHFNPGSAQIGKGSGCAVFIGQCVLVYLSSIVHCSK